MPARALIAASALAMAAATVAAGCGDQAQDEAASSATGSAAAPAEGRSVRRGSEALSGAVEHGATMGAVGTPDTSGLAAGTEDLPAVASWMPRGPDDLDEGAEVAQYVHNLVGTDIVWSEQFVRRTTLADIESLLSDGGASPTPDPSGEAGVRDEDVYWIVGFRSPEPIPVTRINSFMGRPAPGSAAEVGDAEVSTYEGYYVIDYFGNVVRVGIVGAPSGTGTPDPGGHWSLEDILELREVSR